MKILTVDDSKLIRQIVAECVKTMGHDIIFAENGREGVEMVKNNDVDLVLMDIEMPDLNGLEATTLIRQNQGDNWFPIIFLTTHNDDESFKEGILAGGDAYLPKPLNPVRLQMTIVAMERIYLLRQKLQSVQNKLLDANKALERLSLSDALTGLANRRHFDQTLERHFQLALKNKVPLSLILGDIDHFKKYNDHYGHQQGDDCLYTVANALNQTVIRPLDLACRYGGEEFAIIMPETNLLDAKTVAEDVRQAILSVKLPHAASSTHSIVTMSMGVATLQGQYKSAVDLIKAADDALYQAKESGRNRVISL